MAAAAPRILYNNLILGSSVVIVPSSEETSLPRAALLTHHPSDVWRSKSGWTFTSQVNDTIAIVRGGGGGSAQISAGTYATPAATITALVAALEATDAPPVWASSYDSATTHKYTISADLAHVLSFSTDLGAREAHRDLGFNSTDSSSATSHAADNASYQSRHWVSFDMGSAQAFTAAIIVGHNVSASGTVKLQADAGAFTTQGLDEAAIDSTIDFTATLAGSTGLRIVYFASQSKRYLRLVLEDVTNSDGYGEVGVAFVGTYLELAGFEPEVVDADEELSEISYAIGGAHYVNNQPTRRAWELRLNAITAAKKVELEAFAAYAKVGIPFFFNFDSADPSDTRYVMVTQGMRFEAQRTNPPSWSASMRFLDVLG